MHIGQIFQIQHIFQQTTQEDCGHHLFQFFHTSFSPVASTNVEFGPQNFPTFSFNPFATLVHNFKFVPSANPKLLNLNQDHPSKKPIFLVKSLKN